MSDRFFLKLIALFGIINLIFLAFKSRLMDIDAHFYVLMIGNLVLALVSTLSARNSIKSLQSSNQNAFIRAVYGATLSKLMICIVGILAYVLAYKPNISKPTVFILLGTYLIYTLFEAVSMSKLVRQKQ
ncbi:hypothetical protein SAMN05444266_101229 [Chitinophaga jiangningensis]|uniref:ATP synthase I chain n=2 Tax=Chitinophaga jiangningensis TaxID=1419482 RepID=A0A1M6VJ95_9BACT|nr:hypothetical protein SAMN05444266_101229 [Chitinophaga jiangningensis]